MKRPNLPMAALLIAGPNAGAQGGAQGGAVKGGRIIADWPGLRPSDL